MACRVSLAHWEWGLAVSGCIKVACGTGSSCIHLLWTNSTSCGRFSWLQWCRWYLGLWCLAFSWVSSILFWVNQRPYFSCSLEESWAWLKSSVEPWLSVLGSMSTGNIQHSHNPGGFLALLVTVSCRESASCTQMLVLGPWRLLSVKSYLVIGWSLQRPASGTSKRCYSRPSLTDTTWRQSLMSLSLLHLCSWGDVWMLAIGYQLFTQDCEVQASSW